MPQTQANATREETPAFTRSLFERGHGVLHSAAGFTWESTSGPRLCCCVHAGLSTLRLQLEGAIPCGDPPDAVVVSAANTMASFVDTKAVRWRDGDQLNEGRLSTLVLQWCAGGHEF